MNAWVNNLIYKRILLVLKNIFSLILSVFERIIILLLMTIIYPLLYYFYKKKHNIHERNKLKKKIFIASGSPFKYPEDKRGDFLFKERWNNGFRTQILHESFNLSYTIYIGDKFQIYKLCPNIVCIVLKRKKIPLLRRVSKFINDLNIFICANNLYKSRDIFAIETFFPGDSLAVTYHISKALDLPLIAACQGDYDLASFNDSLEEKTIRQIINTIFNKFFFHIFFKQSSLVLGYNDHCASFTICNGAHPKKVRRLRIRPFINDFQKLENIDIPDFGLLNHKKKIFLWSRFSPEKKLYFALDAVKRILKNNENIHFFVAGYGSLDRDLIAHMNDVQDQITFLGNLDRVSIKTYISNVDVNLVPLGGHALIEAGLCKKSVVAFNWEWHTEAITHMKSGILVDYPNIDDLERAILYLLNKPDKSKEMGENLYNRITYLFNEENLIEREKEIFQEFHKKFDQISK